MANSKQGIDSKCSTEQKIRSSSKPISNSKAFCHVVFSFGMPEQASGHQRCLKPSPSMRHQWRSEGGDGGCEQRQRCLWGQAFNNDYKLERGTGPDRLQLWGRPLLWSDPRHRMRRRYNYAPACGKECPETPQWRHGCGRHRGAKEMPAHSPSVAATLRKGQDIKRWIKKEITQGSSNLHCILFQKHKKDFGLVWNPANNVMGSCDCCHKLYMAPHILNLQTEWQSFTKKIFFNVQLQQLF